MIRKFNIIVIVAAGLWLSGCRRPTAFKEVQVPGKFTMDVPVYMQAATDLFGGNTATLQYESDSAKVYMLVFDTARQNLNERTLRQYYDSIVADPSVKNAHISSPRPVMVNTDSALTSDMSAIAGNIPLYYRIEVIATPKRFYYILLWCRSDKRRRLKKDLDKVMGSFTDINHSKV